VLALGCRLARRGPLISRTLARAPAERRLLPASASIQLSKLRIEQRLAGLQSSHLVAQFGNCGVQLNKCIAAGWRVIADAMRFE
jgi:hypothetical protein